MIPLILAAVLALFVLLFIFVPVIAWIIIGIIILVLLVVLLIPVGAEVSYISGELTVSARADGVTFQLYPKKQGDTKPKKEKKTKPEKKKKAEVPETENKKKTKPKLDFTRDELLELVKKVLKGASKFGKLTVQRFMLHYLAGGDDPYKTAVTFNYVNAALSTLAPVSSVSFNVRCEPDVWTDIDFTAEKSIIDTEIGVTVRLIQVTHMGFSIAFGALVVFLKSKLRQRKEKRSKAVTNDEVINIEEKQQKDIQSEERTDSNG